MSETARSDRKNRGRRPKKRKFYGNQYAETQNSVVKFHRRKKLLSKRNFSYEVFSDMELEIIHFITVFNTKSTNIVDLVSKLKCLAKTAKIILLTLLKHHMNTVMLFMKSIKKSFLDI